MQMGRSTSRGLIVVVILTALNAGLPSVGHAGNSKATRARLHQLRERIAKVRHQISSESQKRSKLSDALAKAQKRLTQSRHRLDKVDASIKHTKKRISALDKTIHKQRQQLSGQLKALRKQVRAAYETGRPSRLKLLLADHSPEEIGRELAYYHYFTKAQSKQVAHLKKALAGLAQNRRQLAAKRQTLQNKRQRRAAVITHLQQSRSSQRKTLNALDKQLSSNQQDVASMRANANQLQHLLGQLQNQLNQTRSLKHGNFESRRGHLPLPVHGSTIASFHQYKSGGPLRWQGRWIAAANGTPVKAVAPGRVVYVGYLKRYGLIVIVSHGSRYYTLFGHASSVFCRVGQSVAAGEKIAAAGKSGGHTQSGIFFQIRRGSKPLDPSRWLSR